MKWGFITAAVVLIIAVAGESFYLFDQNEKLGNLKNSHAAQEETIKRLEEKTIRGLEDEKARLESEKTNLSIEIGRLRQEKTELTTQNEKQAEELVELSNQLSTLTPQMKAKNDELRKVRNEVISMKKKFMCDTTMAKPDFSSNDSVSKALAKYVERTKGIDEPVTAHYWNQVWTGEKYSIHTVEVYSKNDRINYVWKFTVYYRGEAYGDHENGVFYNDQQCWLYLDK